MIIIIYGLLIAIPVCLFIGTCNYFKMRQKNNLSWISITLKCVFSAYICVLLAVTFIGRPRITGVSFIPFSSYLEAWQSASMTGWRNILINFIMFVPFGILLPLIMKKNCSLTKVVLIVILFSFGIEIAQMLTHRGVFEIDDIINNTIGALIGFIIFQTAIKNRVKEKK